MRFLRYILSARRIHEAKAARDAARAEYRCALKRGDTRAQHATWKAYRATTHELMRLELGV